MGLCHLHARGIGRYVEADPRAADGRGCCGVRGPENEENARPFVNDAMGPHCLNRAPKESRDHTRIRHDEDHLRRKIQPFADWPVEERAIEVLLGAESTKITQ